MGAEESQFAADGSRPAALLGLIPGSARVEEGLQVSVTQAIDGELAPIDGLQEGVIVRVERVQGPHALLMPANAPFEGGGELFQRGTVVDGGQCRAVNVQRFLRNLGAQSHVRGAATQRAPIGGGVSAGAGAKHAEILGFG